MNRYMTTRFDSPYGGRSPIWEVDRNRIAAFVKDYRLELVPDKRVFFPKDFPGGWRIPHVHFDGETFLLNHEQWTAFARAQLDTFQERLAEVSVINFDSLMEIGDAIIPTPILRGNIKGR